MIIEQADPLPEEERSSRVGPSRSPVDADLQCALAWPISGKTTDALRAQADRLRVFAAADPAAAESIALSLAGKPAFQERAVLLGDSREQLLLTLAELAGTRNPVQAPSRSNLVAGTALADRRVAYLFTGQGAQRVGMGRELYESLPPFKEAFDEVCDRFDGLLDRSLREVVFGDGERPEATRTTSLIDETLFTQTGLFALEVALFRLLDAWGMRPDFLFGHSIGELAAAHVAGVFELDDACRLVAARGRLMGALEPGGAMVAVQASEAEVAESLVGLENRVVLAAVNGPSAVVFSGDTDAVLELAELWKRRGRKTRRLQVSHAFHSPRMDPMLEEFGQFAATVSFAAPTIPLVSNLTGEIVEADQLCDATYWVRHVRETVRFADGVRWLSAQGVVSFLELGPHGVLSAMARDSMPEEELALATPLLRSERPEAETLIGALAQMWVRGVQVDWSAEPSRRGAEAVRLPAYAFQRERYWLDSPRGFWIEQGQLVSETGFERRPRAGGPSRLLGRD